MASLREIRRKIKSVKSTQQITKAMKMVAAARLRRAQARILAARPFAQRIEEMMNDVARSIGLDNPHPLLLPRSGPRRALLLVTSDKGLCGAFNSNLIREALRYIQRYGSSNVDLFVVGRKGRDYFRRVGVVVLKEYLNLFNRISFAQAEVIVSDIVSAYEAQPYSAVDVLYNEFKSVIQQRVIVKQLLPMAPTAPDDKIEKVDYIYEPSAQSLIHSLVTRVLKAQLYRILLESAAAELGAKMASMENASRNAAELINSLTLTMNRTRQAAITKEILEVVSGAEALK